MGTLNDAVGTSNCVGELRGTSDLCGSAVLTRRVLCPQIMIGEGILFCCLSRRHNGAGAEADINAAGCNFNSYIRRAVRFVGRSAFSVCVCV